MRFADSIIASLFKPINLRRCLRRLILCRARIIIVAKRLGNQHQLDALFCQLAKIKLLANASRKKRL